MPLDFPVAGLGSGAIFCSLPRSSCLGHRPDFFCRRVSLFSVFSLSACQGYSILLWSQLCRPSDSLLLIFISVFFLPVTQARLQICFPGQGGVFPPVSTPGAHASYDFCFPPRFGVRRAQMLSTSLVLHAVRTKHRSPWQNFLFLDLVNQF
jgi:hypothetical protein